MFLKIILDNGDNRKLDTSISINIAGILEDMLIKETFKLKTI